jgi:pimeloyl-[acyl-carrier protein] methyl ester esterase
MKKRLIKNREQTITDFYKLMFSPQEEAQGLAGEIIGSALSRGRTWDLIEAQAGLDFLAEADVRAELKRITCPTLLIHGEQDEICPIGGAEFIQRQIPCAQLISYPWVGHIPFLTNFKDFHRALERWLNSYDNK